MDTILLMLVSVLALHLYWRIRWRIQDLEPAFRAAVQGSPRYGQEIVVMLDEKSVRFQAGHEEFLEFPLSKLKYNLTTPEGLLLIPPASEETRKRNRQGKETREERLARMIWLPRFAFPSETAFFQTVELIWATNPTFATGVCFWVWRCLDRG